MCTTSTPQPSTTSTPQPSASGWLPSDGGLGVIRWCRMVSDAVEWCLLQVGLGDYRVDVQNKLAYALRRALTHCSILNAEHSLISQPVLQRLETLTYCSILNTLINKQTRQTNGQTDRDRQRQTETGIETGMQTGMETGMETGQGRQKQGQERKQ